MQTKIPFLLKMFHYVIDQLRKFALPHKPNQSVTKTDLSFTVQDGLEFGGGVAGRGFPVPFTLLGLATALAEPSHELLG
jgi:hypothetical protein